MLFEPQTPPGRDFHIRLPKTSSATLTGPSPGFSSRGGAKNKKRGQNQKGGPHFYNAVLDVCSNRGAKREMGGHRFQMGGRAPLAPPLATALNPIVIYVQANRARPQDLLAQATRRRRRASVGAAPVQHDHFPGKRLSCCEACSLCLDQNSSVSSSLIAAAYYRPSPGRR